MPGFLFCQNVQYFTLDFSLGNVKMLLQKCGDMCHEIKHLPLPEFLCKKSGRGGSTFLYISRRKKT